MMSYILFFKNLRCGRRIIDVCCAGACQYGLESSQPHLEKMLVIDTPNKEQSGLTVQVRMFKHKFASNIKYNRSV